MARPGVTIAMVRHARWATDGLGAVHCLYHRAHRVRYRMGSNAMRDPAYDEVCPGCNAWPEDCECEEYEDHSECTDEDAREMARP